MKRPRIVGPDDLARMGWSAGELYSLYRENPDFPSPVEMPTINPAHWLWDWTLIQRFFKEHELWPTSQKSLQRSAPTPNIMGRIARCA
jgi:hypothetical protein